MIVEAHHGDYYDYERGNPQGHWISTTAKQSPYTHSDQISLDLILG
jgi:hypothetical protein